MFRILFVAGALAVASLSHAQTANAAYTAKDYVSAARLYEDDFKNHPDQMDAIYNAACSYALAGNKEAALDALRRAVDKGFADGAGAEKDRDFDSVRADARFAALIAAMKVRADYDARLFASPALATPYQANISDDEKVAGLSKFWSEVKYNFVYTDKLKELDWDKLYLDYLPKVRATTTTFDYYKVMIELGARLQDGHTNVFGSGDFYARQMARPALRTRLMEGRVIVTEVLDPALEAQGVVKGVEVLAVDGEAALAYGKRVYAPYESASTAQDLALRTYGYAYLRGPVDVAPKVTFADAQGRRFDVAIKRGGSFAAPPTPPFTLRQLPGNIVYVALNSFADSRAVDAYLAAFAEISKAAALVIDVRNNGGGSSNEGYTVLGTLTDKPFATGQWSTRQYLPSFRAWRRPMPDMTKPGEFFPSDAEHQFRGPVRVLTAASTFSAAEDFSAAYASMNRGAIVGETTGGSTGQPLVISLPGGLTARICTKRDTFADGRPWVGIGIVPGIPAAPRIDEFRAGRDTVLEAALASLK